MTQPSVGTQVRGRRVMGVSRPILPLWAALPVAIAAGAVIDAAYPDVGWWPLVFVGFGMLLLTLVNRRTGSAALVGLAFGATFSLLHISWLNRYLGVIPWFALAGAMTIYYVIGAMLIAAAYRWLPLAAPGRWGRLVLLPALVAGLWIVQELLIGNFPYTGFPWARLGMSQSESPLSHVASWLGVTGLSFLMAALVAAVIEWARVGRWRDLRTAVPSLALVAVLLLTPQFPTSDSGVMTVGSVQGNGPAGYFDQRTRNAVLNAQLAATAPLYGQDLDLVLWPEGGIDSDPLADRSTATVLDVVSERLGAPLLVNAATTREDGLTYNTSMLWVPGKGAVALHDKAHPVPFGEYVPDRWLYGAIVPDLVNLIQREYTPGQNQPYVDVNGVGVGLAICFDVIYDSVIHDGIRDGAQVLMFQTNNADFRDTDENLQQLAFARMRAIETGRSVVNISTVGTSQVIAPDGQTIDALPAGEAGAMVTRVPLRTGITPAVYVSGPLEWTIALTSLAALVAAGVVARRRRRNAEASALLAEADAS